MAKQDSKVARRKAEVDESNVREYARNRQAGLTRVSKARTDAALAFEQAIAASSEGKKMLAEARQLAGQLSHAYKRLSQAKLTRVQVEKEHGKDVRRFEEKYRRLAEEAWFSVAEKSPSASRIYRELHDLKNPPPQLSVTILYFLGMIFQYPPSGDTDSTSSTQQALLPPLDLSMTNFSLQITQDHTDAAGGIGFMSSFANPMGGTFIETPSAPTFDNIPAVSSSRALVGSEFTFPAGYTKFTISADIDWNYNMSTWVVFGGAGCGIDLLLRVEPAAGADPVEKLQGLASVLAPVIWGATADGTGSSTVGMSLDLSGAAAMSLKAFAGAASHAEAEGTAGLSNAMIIGTVKRIAVHAE
jgi:hypothetical protein